MLRQLIDRFRSPTAPVELPPPAVEAGDPHEKGSTPAFVARRPLISGRGEIVGFEFRLSDATQWQIINLADPAAESAYAVALLKAMQSTLDVERVAYASLAADLILRQEVAQCLAPRMMICVQMPEAADAKLIERVGALRLTGAQIGWDGQWLAAVHQRPKTDFVALRYVGGAIDGLLAVRKQWMQLMPGVAIVATDIASIEDLEQAARAGVNFVGGAFAVTTKDPSELKPLAPHMQRICRLLNHVVFDAGNARIVEQIRVDVALSYRLLRYINSAAFGLTRRMESIEQAVVLLGRNELYRFLSMMLIGAAEGRKLSHALQEIALTRGRLLELLARERGTDPPEGLFTVGMFSLLDVLFQTPLHIALEPLQLAAPAQQALLEGRGPWRRYLDIALLVERHDFVALAQVGTGFGVGGPERIMMLANEAADWARQVSLEGGL